MRIVYLGKKPEERVFLGKCRACRTEVEFEQREAKTVCDQRDGDYLSVPCPICRAEINVSLNQ